jgi:putative copper resistance protein D
VAGLRPVCRLALVCWIVLAASGVINALVRVTPHRLLTPYGLLVVGKVAALVLLGVLGWLHRREAVPAVVERSDRAAILRLGALEVLVMFATVGLAVALSRTAPPGGSRATQPDRDLFGLRPGRTAYPGAAAAGLAIGSGVRCHRSGSRRRLSGLGATTAAAWLGGCAVILIATSSGLGRYSMAIFSLHMAVHMLLSMMAPILLVLGGPVTLALRALPVAGAGNPPGPREWLLAFTRSWIVRMSMHPLMALGMYIALFYVMYFTSLYDTVAPSHWVHLLMNAHFLFMGYAYYWLIVGIDPTPASCSTWAGSVCCWRRCHFTHSSGSR